MPPKAAGLYPALLAVQAEAPTLQKTAINPHFKSKFVPLDKVHEVVMPILNKHGLIWLTQPSLTDSGSPVLHYRLRHVESGEQLADSILLLPSKADPQGQGSAITYARRYALMAVLGLVADEDDDGNEASRPGRKAVKPLADQVAALPGTVELATAAQKKKLETAREMIGRERFDTYVEAGGLVDPKKLTKQEADVILAWAREEVAKAA